MEKKRRRKACTELVVGAQDAVQFSSVSQDHQHLPYSRADSGGEAQDGRSVVDLVDVLSTQSTSDPDVVKGINESMN